MRNGNANTGTNSRREESDIKHGNLKVEIK